MRFVDGNLPYTPYIGITYMYMYMNLQLELDSW
jgi:hypothetical protein